MNAFKGIAHGVGWMALGASALAFAQQPPAPPSRATVVNSDQRTVWVTVYVPTGIQHRIAQAFCLGPGEKREFDVKSPTGAFKVRGEVTAKPKCQAPVLCDSHVQVGAPAAGTSLPQYEFKTSAQSCWWLPVKP